MSVSTSTPKNWKRTKQNKMDDDEDSVFFDILPYSDFRHKIISKTFNSSEDFCCDIRVNVKDEENFHKWLRLFQEKTKTSWNLRKSRGSEKSSFLYSRDYVCQHSAFGKSVKKVTSKNKSCSASLKVRIKYDTKFTRCRDVNVKEGLVTIIKIAFNHSHLINAAETLQWLKPHEKTRELFMEYFNNGMSPSEAISYHNDLVTLDGPEKQADSSINPKQHHIYYIHNQWRTGNYSSAKIDDNFFRSRKCTGFECVLCGVHRLHFPTRKFHQFPMDPNISDKWATVTGKKWIILASVSTRCCQYQICSKHFKDSDYLSKLKRCLRPDAIPTLNLDITGKSIECSKQCCANELEVCQLGIQKSFETAKKRYKLYLSAPDTISTNVPDSNESTEDICIKIKEEISIDIEEDIGNGFEEDISDSETEDFDNQQTMLADTVKDICDLDECNNSQNKEVSKANEKDNGYDCKKRNLEDLVEPKKITKQSSCSGEKPQQQSLPEDGDEMHLFFPFNVKNS